MAVNKNSVVNIAGYKFEPLVDPVELVSLYQQKCDELELKGTMLISENGINFSLAGTQQATDTIIAFLEKDNRFLNIPLKSVAFDRSHSLISLLNNESFRNRFQILDTELTSHSSILP